MTVWNETLTQISTSPMNPLGVVIHNDAGSKYATAAHYRQALKAMSAGQLENGFAHYYIDADNTYRAMDTNKVAWHTGNSYGNGNFIGFEILQSYGDLERFLANTEATLKQAAIDLKYYGLPANRETVRLHSEFSATACPHRSVEINGGNRAKTQDYFIAKIKGYMNGTAPTPSPKPPVATPSKPKPKPPVTTPSKTGGNIVVNSDVVVTKKVDYNGKKLNVDDKSYKVMEAIGDRIVIQRNGVVVAAIHRQNLKLSGSSVAPKPSPTGGSIVLGSTVIVTKAVDYRGTPLTVNGSYTVMELKGDRAVIGRGGQVTAAVKKGNLKWVGGKGANTAPSKPAPAKPKPTPAKPKPAPAKPKPTIKVGSKVKAIKNVDYNGNSLWLVGSYDVIELKGNRAVIGKGKAVTAAMNLNNLKLA